MESIHQLNTSGRKEGRKGGRKQGRNGGMEECRNGGKEGRKGCLSMSIPKESRTQK